ncbi:MAG: hypothetical protein CME69_02925 [Halobacteriovorax sp.]|nr:hypothetical protein [Halobacteriovorax sp.]
MDIHGEHAKKLSKSLFDKGYRVKVDDRNESMGYKTRQIQKAKIPFMLVIGDREMENNTVSVRKYGEKKSFTWSEEEMLEKFSALDAVKEPTGIN